MSRRARMLKLDQRTGRLERAINLLEDGHRPGLLTRDPDRKHPQGTPVNPGPDRASIKQPIRIYDRGTFNFSFNRLGNSDLTHNQAPCLVFGLTYGTFAYDDAITGYSHYGYGQHGYGGFNIDAQAVESWGG